MIIVIGNHDILPISLFLENNIEVYKNDFEEDNFIFTHHPKVELDPCQICICRAYPSGFYNVWKRAAKFSVALFCSG